jgi:hypothetical protein
MDQISRRNVIGAGIATGALLLSGARPAFAAPQVTWPLFTGFLNNYMSDNFDRVTRACSSPGGWEKWLQTELAIWIVQKDSTYDVWRERHVYIDNQYSVDFLFNDDSEHGSIPLLVELKCQTHNSAFSKNKADYQNQTSTSFKNLLAIDEKKLTKKYLNDKYKSARRYVVAATLENLDLGGYNQLPYLTQQATNNNAKNNNNVNTRPNNNINSTTSMQLDPPVNIYYRQITD